MGKLFKTWAYGCLVGIMLTGSCWFIVGRSNIKPIRQSYNQAYIDFETIQRVGGQLTLDTTGLTKNIANITSKSERIEKRGGVIESGLTNIEVAINNIINKVGKIERANIKLIQLNRDLNTVAHQLRQYANGSRETE